MTEEEVKETISYKSFIRCNYQHIGHWNNIKFLEISHKETVSVYKWLRKGGHDWDKCIQFRAERYKFVTILYRELYGRDYITDLLKFLQDRIWIFCDLDKNKTLHIIER